MNEWYIRGSKELREYLKNDKRNKQRLEGYLDYYCYYLTEHGWNFTYLGNSILDWWTEITFDQYLNQNKMKNIFIEVIDKEHGQKVKEFWKNKGADVLGVGFSNTKKDNEPWRYYGVDKDGKFTYYSLEKILKNHSNIITLPEEKMNTQTIKRIDLISLRSQVKCPEFITKIDGYLMANILLSDEHQIEIQSQDLTLLKEKGSKEQIAAVE